MKKVIFPHQFIICVNRNIIKYLAKTEKMVWFCAVVERQTLQEDGEDIFTNIEVGIVL